MESLKDKIKNMKIEYEKSDIYYQLIGIVTVLIIVMIAFLLVNIDYMEISIFGSFIDFSINVILNILKFISEIIRMILDLF